MDYASSYTINKPTQEGQNWLAICNLVKKQIVQEECTPVVSRLGIHLSLSDRHMQRNVLLHKLVVFFFTWHITECICINSQGYDVTKWEHYHVCSPCLTRCCQVAHDRVGMDFRQRSKLNVGKAFGAMILNGQEFPHPK